jgi:hypothetical protein
MKRLLILTAITAGIAPQLHAQNTTYGGGNAPLSVDAGYVSDYSPDGTIVLADGSVMLTNNATYEHGNNLLQNSGSWTATGSLDLFLSAGSNTISGSTAPSFSNVQFNIGAGNTMAITNAQGVNIAGTLQFNNGITTTVRSTATQVLCTLQMVQLIPVAHRCTTCRWLCKQSRHYGFYLPGRQCNRPAYAIYFSPASTAHRDQHSMVCR